MKLGVSVIATVLNEGQSIEALLNSLLGQTRPPDEIVLVDGGSTDGTLEKLQNFRHPSVDLKVLSRPGANISQGRNVAIAAARGPLIAVTDAGVRLERDWLAQLIAPFEGEHPPDVVSGFFTPDPQSTFEQALGAATLPLLKEIDSATFHPSSRSVAFRRSAWEAVGGYPEWLDYCEDLVFDFSLRDAQYTFAFVPQAMVHFRPRKSLRAFFIQYYRYARGDGKADLWRYRHLIRYATYLGGLPLLLGLALWHHPLWWLGVLGGCAGLLRTPVRRAAPQLEALPWSQRVKLLAWLPLIRLTGDIAKMIGYPVGIWWRWQHAPKTAWSKRQI